MEKSELKKDYFDKQHRQFLEEYKNFIYLEIALILAYLTSKFYLLDLILQAIFFEGLFFVFWQIILVRRRLEEVRRNILRLNEIVIVIEEKNKKKIYI